MSVRDAYHEHVREALERDGWSITADPFLISFGSTKAEIDLAAEKLLAACRGTERIAVEVKCFPQSALSGFHTALGQFLNYRIVLEESYPDYTLYLAIPSDTHETFFRQPIVQRVITRYAINLIVCNIPERTIEQWIPAKPTSEPS